MKLNEMQRPGYYPTLRSGEGYVEQVRAGEVTGVIQRTLFPCLHASWRLFLDMDGVIADFVGAALRTHNAIGLYEKGRAQNCDDIAKLLGISQKDFWGKLDEDPQFWYSLRPTHDAEQLVEFAEDLVGREHVAILTSPAQSEHCVPGKRAFIARHFPQFSQRIIFCPSATKCFVAGPQRVLVDDKESNVEEFRRAGGIGVLVPREWNRLYRKSPQFVLRSMEEQLREVGVL